MQMSDFSGNSDGLTIDKVIGLFNDQPELSQKLITEYTKLSESNAKDYKTLLDNLKSASRTTSEKGLKLEKLVNFLIEKSYFYTVKHNARTSINQIDQLITLSKEGFNFYNGVGKIPCEIDSKDKIIRYLYLPTAFLGECKNYSGKIDVSIIGKVYSVMTTLDMNLAIIFSIEGFTGTYGGWNAGLGLCKAIKLIEKHKNGRDYFYIIDFNLLDFNQILKGKNIFDIIKQKIISLDEGINCNVNYDIEPNQKDFVEEASNIIKSL